MRLRFRRRTASASGLGPDSVEVQARRLHVGDGLCATLAITGYPRDVAPGWLEPLLTYPGRLDVSLHLEPVPSLVNSNDQRSNIH